MAQQDNIIEIRTVESITTSILDYFLNIALVTEIDDSTSENIDLVDPTGNPFDTSGIETYTSMPSVAEKFLSTSKIYKIANAVFTQKNNNDVNQSNVRKFTVLKKASTDNTFEDALNRLGYLNAYFLLINPTSTTTESSDIQSANTWIANYRKVLFAQSNSADIIGSGSTDIASILKGLNATRTATYYHGSTSFESLTGAISAILASYPVGGKTASYKKPTNITVNNLTPSQEEHLEDKNANSYVPFIGGAGDYSTRYLTTANGVVASGDEIQKIIGVDRTVLSLQASLMDALEQDIPYDDNGGTIVYDKINKVFSELKREGVFAEDSVDEETGEMLKSYTIKVLTRATVKKNYPSYFARKQFIVECEIQLAGSAKRVLLTLAY